MRRPFLSELARGRRTEKPPLLERVFKLLDAVNLLGHEIGTRRRRMPKEPRDIRFKQVRLSFCAHVLHGRFELGVGRHWVIAVDSLALDAEGHAAVRNFLRRLHLRIRR